MKRINYELAKSEAMRLTSLTRRLYDSLVDLVARTLPVTMTNGLDGSPDTIDVQFGG